MLWFLIDLAFYTVVSIQLYSWCKKPAPKNDIANAIYIDDAINFHKSAVRHYTSIKQS